MGRKKLVLPVANITLLTAILNDWGSSCPVPRVCFFNGDFVIAEDIGGSVPKYTRWLCWEANASTVTAAAQRNQ